MVYKIVWTENAIEDYDLIIDFLLKNWTLEITQQFILNTTKRINNLTSHPFIGRISNKNKNIRSVLITKHNRLFYVVEFEKIKLLDFFDTRQNPQKSPY